jgi:hypothetical protein
MKLRLPIVIPPQVHSLAHAVRHIPNIEERSLLVARNTLVLEHT